MSRWTEDESIPTHRDCWILSLGGVRGVKQTTVVIRADNSLEVVTMKMEGMFTSVEVVDYDLDDLVFSEDEGVAVFAIDQRVHGVVTRCHGCVKGRNFLCCVGEVVEKCTKLRLVVYRTCEYCAYYGFPSPRLSIITSRVMV